MVCSKALVALLLDAFVSTTVAGWAPPSTRPHGGGSCSSDWDCSLGGTCTEGKCACDPWWTGPQCGYLNLKPASSLHNGLQVPSYNSWGGHCAKDVISGKYVALFSFLVGHCSLWDWTTASSIVMAESDAPEGPYTLVDTTQQMRTGTTPAIEPNDAVLQPPYAHNAYIYYNRAESIYLLYQIGSSKTSNQSEWCKKEATPTSWDHRLLSTVDSRRLQMADAPTLPPWAPVLPGAETFAEDFIGVSWSSSPRGPWSPTQRVEFVNTSANKWAETVSNPAPFVFPNGTTLLFGKGMGCPPGWGLPGAHECLVLFRAPTWRGPYELLTPDHPLTKMEGEDPGIFQDFRGNFHLINNVNTWHMRCQPGEACGGHAWSRDALTWSDNLVGAFGPKIEMTDGTVHIVGYVERPQVYLDESGAPVTFFVGLSGENYADAISWAQPFVTLADLQGKAAAQYGTQRDLQDSQTAEEVVPVGVSKGQVSMPAQPKVEQGGHLFWQRLVAAMAVVAALAVCASWARSNSKIHDHDELVDSETDDEEARDAE